jgi:hypothetical protein
MLWAPRVGVFSSFVLLPPLRDQPTRLSWARKALDPRPGLLHGSQAIIFASPHHITVVFICFSYPCSGFTYILTLVGPDREENPKGYLVFQFIRAVLLSTQVPLTQPLYCTENILGNFYALCQLSLSRLLLGPCTGPVLGVALTLIPVLSWHLSQSSLRSIFQPLS